MVMCPLWYWSPWRWHEFRQMRSNTFQKSHACHLGLTSGRPHRNTNWVVDRRAIARLAWLALNFGLLTTRNRLRETWQQPKEGGLMIIHHERMSGHPPIIGAKAYTPSPTPPSYTVTFWWFCHPTHPPSCPFTWLIIVVGDLHIRLGNSNSWVYGNHQFIDFLPHTKDILCRSGLTSCCMDYVGGVGMELLPFLLSN